MMGYKLEVRAHNNCASLEQFDYDVIGQNVDKNMT